MTKLAILLVSCLFCLDNLGCGGRGVTVDDVTYDTTVYFDQADGGEEDAMRGLGTTLSRGWSGQTAMFTQEPSQVGIGIQATFPEASNYTLQFGVIPPTGGKGVYRCVATVIWKNEGNTLQRQIDVVNGASITGFGMGVTVSLADLTPDYGQGGVGSEYQVQQLLTPGTRPSQDQPPRLQGTTEPLTIAPASPATIAIPQNAGVISVYVNGNSEGTDPIDLIGVFESNATTLSSFDDGGLNKWVPVPAGATVLVLQNVDSSDSIAMSVIWGIDG